LDNRPRSRWARGRPKRRGRNGRAPDGPITCCSSSRDRSFQRFRAGPARAGPPRCGLAASDRAAASPRPCASRASSVNAGQIGAFPPCKSSTRARRRRAAGVNGQAQIWRKPSSAARASASGGASGQGWSVSTSAPKRSCRAPPRGLRGATSRRHPASRSDRHEPRAGRPRARPAPAARRPRADRRQDRSPRSGGRLHSGVPGAMTAPLPPDNNQRGASPLRRRPIRSG
jgi:hypothetical protein